MWREPNDDSQQRQEERTGFTLEKMVPQIYVNLNGGNIILAFSIFTLVASITNGLRFWARRIIHLGPGLDDYLSALLLLLVYGLLVDTILAVVFGGLGTGFGRVGGERTEQETAWLFQVCHHQTAQSPLPLVSSELVKHTFLAQGLLD